MRELDMVRAEWQLRTAHLPSPVTPEAQFDYNLWNMHDTENHEQPYAACPPCCEEWYTWYNDRNREFAATMAALDDLGE